MKKGTNHHNRLAFYYGGVAVLLWSTVAVAFKLGLEVVSPLQLLWLGTGVSSVFFLCVANRKIFQLSVNEGLLGIGLGILNPFVYYLILFEAYNRLPAHIAQPLNYTWAITLSLLAIPVLRQKLFAPQIAGIFVSYVGVVLLITRGDFNNWQHFDSTGVLLALSSTLIWACYWLANTKARQNPHSIMALSFTVGFCCTSLLCWHYASFPAITGETLFYGAWVGLIEMGVTYLLWQKALSLTSQVARISQLIFLSPILSLVLIANLLGEDIHWTALLALGLIIVGIVFTSRSKLPTQTPID